MGAGWLRRAIGALAAALLAPACTCHEKFEEWDGPPIELSVGTEGIEKSVSVRTNGEIVSINLIVRNSAASPSAVEVASLDANSGLAPFQILPGLTLVEVFCQHPPCAEVHHFSVRSLGGVAEITLEAPIRVRSYSCEELQFGVTIE